MNRALLTAAVAASLVLGACGSTEVVVQAQLEGEGDAAPVALRNLPIRLLPYDRDAIFDSLTTAYPTPQPEIPAGFQALEQQITEAEQEWQSAEARWAQVRDSLQQLSNRMRGMNQRSGEYLVMYRDFGTLEGQEATLSRQKDQAFARFTSLQQQYGSQADEIRVARENWADEAYAPFDSIKEARMAAMRQRRSGTRWARRAPNASRCAPAATGCYARYELPYQELYWNVPIEVSRGETVQVILNRQNAQVRPKL
jgi:hypothetical protein